MHPRSDNDGRSQSDPLSGTRRGFGPARLPSARVRELRMRLADDAYRSADVAEEIARRILRSRDL
ncbi:MAG TPA: hypothetical protein VGP25_22025 [Gemmatimonadaceae bacterium]|jgi:hypothetical protein|nr:hypothetical protein [Gemmatimonadaceae bacterium]